MVFATVLFVIPAIYLFPVFSLMLPILVFEDVTIGYAFDRCFNLIKGKWAQVFGTIMVLTIIIVAAAIAIMIPVLSITGLISMLSNIPFANAIRLPVLIFIHLVQFVYLIPIIAIALSYFNLLEQKEGTSLMERIENFGSYHTPDVSHLSSEEY